MKRRSFLKNAIPATAIPFMLNGLPISVFGKGSFFESLSQNTAYSDRVLVLIQLVGGNDGLNTVIPLDQYTNLAKARANILINDSKVLPLKDSSITGLHPSLSGIQELYGNKQATIIQGVGYSSPSYSHFRSTDIWCTGSDADTFLTSGWLGRYLDQQYTGYPTGYPNDKFPDPPAIQIGTVVSSVLQGQAVNMAMAIINTSEFHHLVTDSYKPLSATPAERELIALKQVANETNQYSVGIKKAAGRQANLSRKYPAAEDNDLANVLKVVAQLIGGGLKTKVYVVTLNGFDNHDGQVDTADSSKGVHAHLLKQFSEAIVAFEDDLYLMGKQDKVLGMTFSEFGRRIKSNASYGTDHGSSQPVFLFGTNLKGGLVGHNPVIPDHVRDEENLPWQHDFRSLYTSIIKGWFGVTDNELQKIMLNRFPTLDLFK